MAGKLAVVLTSGGLDSAVAAALAAQDGPVALLHVQYGQQAAEAEKAAFEAIGEWAKPARQRVVSLGTWGDWVDSPLLSAKRDIEDAAAVGAYLASTFVPMLAPAMLCAAAAWAYTLRADRVVWGFSLDNPGNYPDRADAVRLLAWQLLSRCLPAERGVTIEAPLAQFDKLAVAGLAGQLEVPVNRTWSCLRAGPSPCGRCIGCVTRAKALDTADGGDKS